MKEIIVKIQPDGKIVVQTKGYQGAECLDASKAIEEALGEVGETKYTTEFYEETVGVERVSQGK